MESPLQSKRADRRRKSKRSPNQPIAPPQKDAYARLLSQHHSSKFRAYLEQYVQEPPSTSSSAQVDDRDGHGPTATQATHSERVDIPQAGTKATAVDFSDSSDFSPSSFSSSMKGRCEESALALYMEKLNGRGGGGGGALPMADPDRKQSVGERERQRRGPRRDTTASNDGDVDSAEENGSSNRPVDARPPPPQTQQPKKNKGNNNRDSSHQLEARPYNPNVNNAANQEQEKNKKRQQQPQQQKSQAEEGRGAELSGPKTPLGKAKQMHKSQGRLKVRYPLDWIHDSKHKHNW